MQINAFRRVAAVALFAALLTAAGQGAAVASDPQWEADPQWESAPLSAAQQVSGPRWDSAPPTAQP